MTSSIGLKQRLACEAAVAAVSLAAAGVLMGWPTAQGPYVPSDRYFQQLAAWWFLAGAGVWAVTRLRIKSQRLLAVGAAAAALLAAEGLCRLGGWAAWGGGAGPLQPTLQGPAKNSFGWRGPEPPAHAAGRRIVFALGDSFTYGQGVALKDVYASVLERRLRPEAVAFVNAGMPGAHTANELAALERVGWQMRPRALLLQVTLNDAETGPYRLRPLWPWPGFERTHLRRSHLYFLLVKAYNQLVQPYDRYIAALYEEGRPGLAQMEGALSRMGEQARERGVPAICVIFPMFTRFDAYPYGDVHARIAVRARAAGFTVVDLLPRFLSSGRPAADYWAAPYDPHPNAAAHALAAEALLPVLRELRL